AVQPAERAGYGHHWHQLLSYVIRPKTLVQINEHNNDAINFVIESAVRTDSHRIPFSIIVFNLVFLDLQCVDHAHHTEPDIGNPQIRFDIRDWPSYIGGNKVHDLLRHRCKPADAEIVSEHNYRNVDAAEEVAEVVVRARQFIVPVLQLLVYGRQL